MANSIKEYKYIEGISGSNPVYTTPDYLEGRGDTDIQVWVGDEHHMISRLVQDTDYSVVDTQVTIDGYSLSDQEYVYIKRVSSPDARLTDYVEGSLLTADTLDADANQIFYLTQEALDEASRTNMAAGDFYYAGETAPTRERNNETVAPPVGTLWYDMNASPNILKVWDGVEWYPTTPLKVSYKFTNQSDEYTSQAGSGTDIDFITTTDYNSKSDVFLNGIKLSVASDVANIDTDGDYFYNTETNKLYLKALGSDDVLIVETFSGGFATTVLEAEARIEALANNAETAASNSGEINVNISNIAPELIKLTNHPEDQTFAFEDGTYYSALHYSAKASEFADAASDHVATASGHAGAASTQALNAQKYANHPIDSQYTNSVGEQGYSAKHYNAKAAEYASQASASIGTISGHVSTAADHAADALAKADIAEGHASDASGYLSTVQASTDLAAKYADSDAQFDDNGELKYSAKYYSEEMSNTFSGIQDTVAQADALEENLKLTVNNPAGYLIDDGTHEPFYSARHYSELAQTAANQTVDNLIGWDLIDANTISTNVSGAPVIHSSTSLDLQATTAVRANNVPLPFEGGVLNLQADYIGFNNSSITRNANTFAVTFDTSPASATAYHVMATYSGNNTATIKVVKYPHKFEVTAYSVVDGTEVNSGEIVVTVYKFT